MNQRPTRAAETAMTDSIDSIFHDIERTNNVPATRAQSAPPVNEAAPQGDPQPPLPKTECTNLLGAIAAVMAEIQPVEKGGWNKFQSYAFARMQDLLVTVTPLMGKHGIVVFQHEEGREMFDGGKAIAIRYRFTIVHKSGEVWFERPLQTGLSNCRATTGAFDDKALNKCHTAARKYFLMSLFQIPTEDMEDADNTQGSDAARQRPQGQRRPVPSPEGKLSPHLIPIIDGEAPEAWAKRFKDFIGKAASVSEVDKWYDLNAVAFEKLKGRFQTVYDDLIDTMDQRTAAFDKASAKAAAPDPTTTGKPDSGFPGDTKMVSQGSAGEEIPISLDRKLTETEQDWLISLDEAFRECVDSETLASEQESVMMPSKEHVSEHAWVRAVAITAKHLARIQHG